MSNDSGLPTNVGSNDGLGQAPKRADVERLMKRCQIGVGGRNALDYAHDIMADCYGTLGAMMLEIERLRAALGAVHWRVSRSDAAFDDATAAVLVDVCEQACPDLRALWPNVEAKPTAKAAGRSGSA